MKTKSFALDRPSATRKFIQQLHNLSKIYNDLNKLIVFAANITTVQESLSVIIGYAGPRDGCFHFRVLRIIQV